MIRRVLMLSLMLLPGLARAQTPMTPGQITWGLAATFPPFEFVENGKPVGFDVDLADAIAKKMDLQSTITTYDFKGLIPAMLGHRMDAIISGMYENAQRREVADFIAYIKVGNQIVVRNGNPLKLDSRLSLCGKRVAAPVGTAFEVAAKLIATECVAGGKPDVTLLSLAGTTTCALALTQDRADAIIVSTPTAAALMHETPGAYDAAGKPFDDDTLVGIAVPKGVPNLGPAIDKALKAVVADGSYAALLTKWNLPASSSAF
ncbi:MAG: ABC transporter substrate-binding protein [Acetobacteraceae bacterium]